MFLKENISLALAGLKSNKMRAALTMLGIIIGIGSVIAIVSIGDALTLNVKDTMSSMGASGIYVYVSKSDNDSIYSQMSGNGSDKIDDSDLLSQEQIDEIQTKFADKTAAIGFWSNDVMGKAQDHRLYANVDVLGCNPGLAQVTSVKVTSGRFLQDKDIARGRHVAVVSDRFVSNMFPAGKDPLGKEVDVTTDDSIQTYTIIGVYNYQSTGMMGSGASKDITTVMYIPISVAQETAENKNYSHFELIPKDPDNTEALTKELNVYCKKFYANNTKYTCSAYNMENMVSMMSSMLGVLSIAVAAIAAIALVVGGIGVMNIMLVSVTERTREIGTRMALGARSGAIRMQFIVESVIICLIGGIIGVAGGIGLAALGVHLLNMKFVISVPTILISVAFSMLIGVFFGYYPAKKASQLDPIEALRYE